MFKISIGNTFHTLVLCLGSLVLSACIISEDLDPPPSEDQNRILGLKVESVQFNTKRPNSTLNPHDETRVGTSFIIPLGKEGSFMPLEEDLPDSSAVEEEPGAY